MSGLDYEINGLGPTKQAPAAFGASLPMCVALRCSDGTQLLSNCSKLSTSGQLLPSNSPIVITTVPN